MGGSKKSEFWTMRVRTDQEIEWLDHKFRTAKYDLTPVFFAYVRETGKKSGHLHYHFALAFADDVTQNEIDYMKKKIKEQYNLPNLSVQSKVWDGEERYVSYMNKENDMVHRGTMLYDIKSPDEYRRIFELERMGLKRLKENVVQDVTELVNEKILELNKKDAKDILKIHEIIVDTYMEYYRKRKLNHPSDFVVKLHFKNILLKINLETGKNYVRNKYLEFF